MNRLRKKSHEKILVDNLFLDGRLDFRVKMKPLITTKRKENKKANKKTMMRNFLQISHD